ncbi:protein FAR1-related sequence 5 [Tanacetum coccineum]
MDPSHSSAVSSVSHNSVSSDVVDESCVPSGSSLNALTEEIVAYEKESDETHVVKKLDALCTPESFVTHFNFDTPSGTYAAKAGFVVRRSCQKRMLIGDVKQKYLVCNRMGCPKGIHVDTLDLENSDKLKRKSNLHITGCKARVVFNLDSRTRKFVLNVFDTIHNHELEHEEFKHLSKRERQMTYLEQAFIVKAASVNIGATKAHQLLTGIKGSYLLVHDGNRKKYVSDFSFDYLVENVELSEIFWADEVSKYNYREFGDVVSFDATFKTNKYKMVFVPFTAIDNHRKCVTVAAAPSIVVTDQDGAMRNAIEAEFTGSKHQLCMWHITQKLPAKICAKIYDETDFKEKPEIKLSESENSFFFHFTNSGSTLMNFENCFETAMEKQRHVQERMDHKTIDTVPKLKNFLKIERHASNVYTRSLFELVRKEIFVGLWHCQIDSKSLVEGSEVCIIKESPYVYEMPKKKKKP